MPASTQTSWEKHMPFLDILYDQLDFKSGNLHAATDKPLSGPNSIDWLEKGEWLSSAKRIGAEKIFFVESNPVAVFAECETSIKEKIKTFNNAWCLARPRLLFLASPGEITVYDLAQKPIDIKNPKAWNNLRSLETVDDLTKVSRKLQQFHRDNVESGRLFADKKFGDLNNRADKALIRDLKTVRRELIDAGLKGNQVRFAHALIGRSIFIRYLEDRGILTKGYFDKIARQNSKWTDILSKPVGRAGSDFSDRETFYPRVLSNKDFTYALFRKLAQDFNGDMFPDVDEEARIVSLIHLKKLQDLLFGDAGIQKKLFFYSYRFDIIPLDLISSIYEEFYHGSVSDDEKKKKKNKVRQDGAYYTPPVLAEFVLSRVLTTDILKNSPRVIDPACGSGIFLVEAFRRIVRYEWHKKQRPLTFDELKGILKEQIAGIEANDEAARITAFSLYLSMLHYLDPPAIDRQIKMGNRLPNLIATTSRSTNHLHCILHSNTFDIERIESIPYWKERFGKGCADVVVGNPPWGAPGNKADAETKARHQTLLDWCHSNNKPIGDGEPSQAFLWRALDFLKTNGKAGMLVSAGVLYKHSTTTQQFRKRWFDRVRLEEIFNFSHVRKFFFKGADSPFLSLFFSKEDQNDKPVSYWSAKQTITMNKTQAIALSKYDMHIVWHEDLMGLSTWKEFWFGRSADRKFLDFLRINRRLIQYSVREESGRGYQLAAKDKNAAALQPFRNLVINTFSRYDSILFTDPPETVHRLGVIGTYEGKRLLVQRGIEEKTADKGRIVARYEADPFCFTNAIHGIKLESPEEWKYKTILGILWSSVARYFFFMTSSNWGLWHHEIHLDDELLQLPVILDRSNPVTEKVIIAVDKLRNYHPGKRDIFHPHEPFEKTIEAHRREWESELDEAVFDLYEMNDEQKDLIHDFNEVTLPFFYRPFDSTGAMPAVTRNDLSWIEHYIHIFNLRWRAYLGSDEEMRGEVHMGAHDNMLAIEFFVADKGDPYYRKVKDNGWGSILDRLGEVLPQPMGLSQIILDGFVHIVSDSGIILIKRNEKRFWTRSLAREDADATICKRMQDTMPNERRPR
jgi:type I restriction-modification system DNA methylase subunit